VCYVKNPDKQNSWLAAKYSMQAKLSCNLFGMRPINLSSSPYKTCSSARTLLVIPKIFYPFFAITFACIALVQFAQYAVLFD